MASSLEQARSHYDRQRRVAAAASVAAQVVARQGAAEADIQRILTAYQAAAATAAVRSLSEAAGRPLPVNPLAFAGQTSAGYPISAPLKSLLPALHAAIDDIANDLSNQLDREIERLQRFVASEVQDAGRQAAGVAIVVEPSWTNYVRVLDPPSCSRCAILAGRIYRDNEGFQRHPLCDCQHWPVTSWSEAKAEGLLTSPDDAFERGQVTGLSESDARAIREGSDISQVVNAAQGMSTTVIGSRVIKTTTAGTTRRGGFRRDNPNLPYRLRPEAIYQIASADREEVLRLLRLYGYLTS